MCIRDRAKAAITKNLNQALKDEVPVNDKQKIMILGGGPNRIGQGIEFDYTLSLIHI